VAAGRSTEPERGAPGRPAGSLSAAERLAALGVILVAASLLLPWYGLPFSGGLAVTGLDSFGLGQLALVITAAAAAFVLARSASGRPIRPPLRPWALLVAAGGWAAVLVAVLMLDKPEELAGSTRVGLRMGLFVALAGSGAIVAGGLRLRVEGGGRARGVARPGGPGR
jgi:hypothetical protein